MAKRVKAITKEATFGGTSNKCDDVADVIGDCIKQTKNVRYLSDLDITKEKLEIRQAYNQEQDSTTFYIYFRDKNGRLHAAIHYDLEFIPIFEGCEMPCFYRRPGE